MLGRSAPAPSSPSASRPGACFAYVSDPERQGQPMACPGPAIWRGVFFDAAGREYLVDACPAHMGHLLDPTTAISPVKPLRSDPDL